jgi:hypothetical protein
MTAPWEWLARWLEAKAAVLRLEIIRIFAPLAVLGFMSPRLAHADEWIGRSGFRVPDLGGAVNQPVYIPALPPIAVWAVAAIMVSSGLATSIGWRTRASALVFAATLAFVTLSDRAAAFTVSKISPAVMVALAFAPAGRRLGVDAWLALRRGERCPQCVPLGSLRFVQIFLPVFYCASGIAKARGEWSRTCTTATRRRSRTCSPASFPAGGGPPFRPSSWRSRRSRRCGSRSGPRGPRHGSWRRGCT